MIGMVVLACLANTAQAETLPGYSVHKPVEYEYITKWDYAGNDIYYFRQNGKAGLCDGQGNIILDCIYEDIQPISGLDGLYAVAKDGREGIGGGVTGYNWGVVDRSGQVIVPLIYHDFYTACEGGKYFSMEVDSGYRSCLVDSGGNVLTPVSKGLCLYEFLGDVVVMATYDLESYTLSHELYNLKMREYIFQTPLPYCSISLTDNVIVAGDESSSAIVDSSGKVLVPMGAYEAIAEFSEGTAIAYADGKIVKITTNGVVSETLGMFDADFGYADRLLFVSKNGKCGVIDDNGKTVVPLLYSNIMYDGGAIIAEASPEQIDCFNRFGHPIPLVEPGRFNINISGEERFTPPGTERYDSLSRVWEGYFCVSKEGRDAVIDAYGNLVIPFGAIDSVDSSGSRYMDVVFNGKHGIFELHPYLYMPDEPSGWALPALEEAAQLELITFDMMYGYQDTITRKEFCDLLEQLFVVQTGQFPIQLDGFDDVYFPFYDVDSRAVNGAYGMGIVSGKGECRFDPDAPVTRQDAAVMLSRAVTLLNPSVAGAADDFTDDAAIAEWAKPHVALVSAEGIMSGTGNRKFDPTGFFTREQAMIAILKLHKSISLR